VVPPSEGKRSAARRMTGSLSVWVVPAKQGERSIDCHPVEGRQTPEHGTVF
jgi:hypothetical protein